MSASVNGSNMNIRVRNTYRDVLRLVYYLHGAADRRFGRTIAVHNVKIGIQPSQLAVKLRWECLSAEVHALQPLDRRNKAVN